MARHKLTIEEFAAQPPGRPYSAHVYYGKLQSWCHLSQRVIEGRQVRCIVRANTMSTRPGRGNNCTVDYNIKPTGEYKAFDNAMMLAAKKNGFDGVFIENVLNDFLLTKLVEYGYTRNNEYGGPPCFWKPV